MAKKKKKLSKEQLEDLYITQRKTPFQIGQEFDVSDSTLRNLLNQYGISIRNRSEARLPPGVVKPNKERLEDQYITQRKTAAQIGQELSVRMSTILDWLKSYEIPIRSWSEAKLPPGVVKPNKEQLEDQYAAKRKSTIQIAEELGVSTPTVNKWLKSYDIPIRNASENQLPESVVKPGKEELERMYVTERKTHGQVAEELGVSAPTVNKWLKSYDIPIKSKSEAKLPEGVVKPSKEWLEGRYISEGKSTIQIAEELGVANSTVGKWFKAYSISLRRDIGSGRQLVEFLRQDKTAAALAGASLGLGEHGTDIEAILIECYEGKFKDQSQLHRLLQENSGEIYEVLQEGITNLGFYIGQFNLGDRSIIPILLGQAIVSLPEQTLVSLEDRLVKILRDQYGPQFSKDPKGTVKEITERMGKLKGKPREIYGKLEQHYESTLALGKELK